MTTETATHKLAPLLPTWRVQKGRRMARIKFIVSPEPIKHEIRKVAAKLHKKEEKVRAKAGKASRREGKRIKLELKILRQCYERLGNIRSI